VITPVQRGVCVDLAIKEHGVTAARACKIFDYNRTNHYYEKRMPSKNEEVKYLIENKLGRGN